MSATTDDRPVSDPADEGRMPLLEHLRELRSRLVRGSLAVIAGSVVAWFFYQPIIDLLIDPVCDAGAAGVSNTECGPVVVSSVLGPLSLQLKVSLFGGLLLTSPIWLYQLWAFLAPGLHRNEKRWTYAFVSGGVPLFLAGAGASYLILPKAIRVLLDFTPGGVGNLIPLDQYLDFVLRMLLIFGLAFELPLVLIVANLAGLLSGRRIASWWRGMVFGIFVFAAAATPTGDPLTMAALAAPMILLYAVAVVVAVVVDRTRRRRKARDDEAGQDQARDDEAGQDQARDDQDEALDT